MTGSNNINAHNLLPVSCFHNRQALMKLYEYSFIEHVKPDDCESMKLAVAYICWYYLIRLYVWFALLKHSFYIAHISFIIALLLFVILLYIYILQAKANKLTLLVFGFLRKRTLYRYSVLIKILDNNFFRVVANVLTCIAVVASLRVQLIAKLYFWKVATAKAWKRFCDVYFKLFKIAVVFWLEYFVVLSLVGITEVYFEGGCR